MSYDLNFWRPAPDLKANPQEVYERLCDGELIKGLQPLPVQEILAKIKEAFPAVDDTYGELDWQGAEGEGAFQVSHSPQHVRVDSYGLPDAQLNKFIDIAYQFSCVFYDPQVGQLFTAPA